MYEVSDYYGLIGIGVDSVEFKEGEWYLNGIIEKKSRYRYNICRTIALIGFKTPLIGG